MPPDEDESIERLIADERLQQLGGKAGLKPRPLTDFLDGELPRPLRRGEAWEDRPNAVYLPTFSTAQVWTRLDELASAPHAYYQLPLDPTKALAEYVAAFLRTPLGFAVRESVSSKGVRAHIRRSALETMPIFAPPISDQREFVAARRPIVELRLQLDQLDRRLASHPRSAKQVKREVLRLNERDGFARWLDSLPFPLASIAHTYRAAAKGEPGRKSSALLRLFEGTAEFACAVLLSGYRGSQTWDEHHDRWLAGDGDGSLSLRVASFGTWTVLGSRMASTTRQLLDDGNSRQEVLKLFALTTPALLAGLCSKGLWKTLDVARIERNRHKAHGSLESDTRDAEQLQRLELLLDDYRSSLADTFEGVVLFRPGLSGLRRGIYHYDTATRLMGPNPIFSDAPVQAKLALESDEVYLAEDVEVIQSALQLAPFVRFLEVPKSEQNACWFFNRIENGVPVFVCNHYSADPIPREDADLLAWLDEMEAS